MEQRVFTALVTDHRLGRRGSSQQGRIRIQTGLEQLEKQSVRSHALGYTLEGRGGAKHASSPGLVLGSPRS